MKEVCFKALLEGFESPEREYYPSVMWFWNDTLDHAEITAQLTERLVAMAERLESAGVRTVWIGSLPETAVDTASPICLSDWERIVLTPDFTPERSADPRWVDLLRPLFADYEAPLKISHPGGIYSGLRRAQDATLAFLSNDTASSVTACVTCPEQSAFCGAKDASLRVRRA